MIEYVTGDATNPQGDGPRVIAHIVNDEGKWGRGFVLALSRRDLAAEEHYRAWARNGMYDDSEFGPKPFALGQTQFVAMEAQMLFTANMCAQRGVRHDRSAPRAVQYDALRSCLEQLAEFCALYPVAGVASVHMPRIGCGLGGGSWEEIEPILRKTLTARAVPVTVYDL